MIVQGKDRPGPFHEGRRPIQSGFAMQGRREKPNAPGPPDDESLEVPPVVTLTPAKSKMSPGEMMEEAAIDAAIKAALARPVLAPGPAPPSVAIPGTGHAVPALVAGIVAGLAVAGSVAVIRGFGGFQTMAPTFQPGTLLFRP